MLLATVAVNGGTAAAVLGDNALAEIDGFADPADEIGDLIATATAWGTA